MDSRSKPSRNIATSTLPQEIIDEEILPRLMVNSLLKFRCVSKSWCSLIDSKKFIKIHHKNSMKNQSFPHQRMIKQRFSSWPIQCPLPLPLLNGSNLDPFLLEDPTSNPLGSSFGVVGCCNGLVCILERPATFLIWNPSTRITKKLPQVSGNMKAFNCGFGWVESSGEYKVYATFMNAGLNKIQGKIYSSKTKSWKAIEPILDYNPGQVVVFVGEKLHYYGIQGGIIIFLDLKTEVFGRIETTPIPRWNSCRRIKRFGVLGGCICVVLYNYGSREVIEVWVVKEYGAKDCWERVVARDRVLELLQQTPSIVGPNGEILVFFISNFLAYYPKHNVFRLLQKHDGYHSRYLCIESLESPEAL